MFIPLSRCVLLVFLSAIILQRASDNGPSPAEYLLLSLCRRCCASQSRAPRDNCLRPLGDPQKYLPPAARNLPLDNHGSASAPSPKCRRQQPPATVRRRSASALFSKSRQSAPAPRASARECS